jgi:NADPH2:quinone reductase
MVGVVDRLGAGVSGLTEGQQVAALPIRGGYAEYICLPQAELVTLPSGLDPVEAVCLVMNYIVAHQTMVRLADIQPGERVLIHGAAGGVGTALLELGKLAELEMYGTASGKQCDLVSNLGGTPIDYTQVDFVHETKRLTGYGVDVVFDGIGGTHLLHSYPTLCPGGRLIFFGHSAALVGGRRIWRKTLVTVLVSLAIFALNLLPARRTVKLYSIQTLKRQHPDWFRTDLKILFDLLAHRKIRPVIAKRMRLEKAAYAHELLVQSSVAGKIVLVCNSSSPHLKVSDESVSAAKRQ